MIRSDLLFCKFVINLLGNFFTMKYFHFKFVTKFKYESYDIHV
jgi:hypothetical protein